MKTVDVTFNIPEHIVQGFSNGIYERAGGVVREIGSKRVVTWLREGNEISDQILSNISAHSSSNAVSDTLNLALSSVSAVSSTLNLAVSTMGFIIVLQRLGIIEQQLEQAQEVLRRIDYKIDLSFYANFRAALDLAMNAFTMTNSDTRKMSAMQAINRFLEAEHQYTKLTDIEIGNGSQVADEYLSTLCLAYVTEVRCYLELEELDTARRRLKEGVTALRPRFEKHINTLLTSNPAAYLHPSLQDQVGLKRLTKVYQWLEPGLDESDVFERQRENLFNLAQKPEKWIVSLPQAIRISKGSSPKKWLPEVLKKYPEIEIFGCLPEKMDLMESMIENDNRLAMYESEVEMIHRLGMSFQEWRQLTPLSTAHGNGTDLIYITVS